MVGGGNFLSVCVRRTVIVSIGLCFHSGANGFGSLSGRPIFLRTSWDKPNRRGTKGGGGALVVGRVGLSTRARERTAPLDGSMFRRYIPYPPAGSLLPSEAIFLAGLGRSARFADGMFARFERKAVNGGGVTRYPFVGKLCYICWVDGREEETFGGAAAWGGGGARGYSCHAWP